MDNGETMVKPPLPSDHILSSSIMTQAILSCSSDQNLKPPLPYLTHPAQNPSSSKVIIIENAVKHWRFGDLVRFNPHSVVRDGENICATWSEMQVETKFEYL
ncbi:hypothetical protein L2E82_40525 [Cichorium intybus]|uniref:Uncharacterized protein n=1 Tax=Cichorium intybus TaxID=13427 RepID=A0ACB9AL09_CICIN|nr:hypothetical protein L2E82_40525 [Cichorium intybus]